MAGDQKDGGPAFPNPALANEGYWPQRDESGMTLRDWFAGQALSEILRGTNVKSYAQAAEESYKLSDAMLAAREATP